MIMLGWFALIVVCAALLVATVRDVRQQLRPRPDQGAELDPDAESDVPSIVPSAIRKGTE